MLGRDHQITSGAITLTLMATTAYPAQLTMVTAPMCFVATAVGALLPDVDHQNSKISKISPIPFYRIFQHRGATHSLFGLGVFAGLMYVLNLVLGEFMLSFGAHGPFYFKIILISLTLGYFLHLLEDSWSQAGIRWLAPFSGYDQYVYNRNHILLRKAVRFKKNRHGKSTPLRHWWGRGYQVGGLMEYVITGFFVAMAIFAIMRGII